MFQFVSEDYLLNEKMSDVTLIVDNKQFPSHRFVLGANSEVFYKMFYGNMKESHEKQVVIEGVSADTFSLFLKYIYHSSNSCEITDAQQAMDVIRVAHQYQIYGIVNLVENTLQNLISVSNLNVIYNFAKLYSLNVLTETCVKFVNQNIKDFLNDETFLMSPIDELKQLLSFVTIPVKGKQLLMNALKIIRQQNPNEDLECLFNLIAIEEYTIEELIDNIRPFGVINIDHLFQIIKERSKTANEYINEEFNIIYASSTAHYRNARDDIIIRYEKLERNYKALKLIYVKSFNII